MTQISNFFFLNFKKRYW